MEKLLGGNGLNVGGKEAYVKMELIIPKCPICRVDAIEISGETIYPHRPDLFNLKFYQCFIHKDYYVGCHKKTGIPLGVLADKEHRRLKMQCHTLFDKLWLISSLSKEEIRSLRKSYYAKLANDMKLDIEKTHFGMFTKDQCRQALEILKGWKK